LKVACLETDPDGNPRYILNPVIEVYAEPPMSIGDYDRIILDVTGRWHWEHNEFYPEYYVGQKLVDQANSNEERNRSTKNFPSHIEVDDPLYGEQVNSLCWYEYADTFEELMEVTNHEIHHLSNISVCVDGKHTGTFAELTAFVNPQKLQFSPKRSINSQVISSRITAPEGYWHWLSVGYCEQELFAHIFYPKWASSNINIIADIQGKQKDIKWIHGQRGLFAQQILPLINSVDQTSFLTLEYTKLLSFIDKYVVSSKCT